MKKLLLFFIVLIIVSVGGFVIISFSQTYKYWNAYYQTGKTSVIHLDKKYNSRNKTVTFKTILHIPEEQLYCRIGTLVFCLISVDFKQEIKNIIIGRKCTINLTNNQNNKSIDISLADILYNRNFTTIGYGTGQIIYPENALSFLAYAHQDNSIVSYKKGLNKITICVYPVNKKVADSLQAIIFFSPSTEKAARFIPFFLCLISLLLLIFLMYLMRGSLRGIVNSGSRDVNSGVSE